MVIAVRPASHANRVTQGPAPPGLVVVMRRFVESDHAEFRRSNRQRCPLLADLKVPTFDGTPQSEQYWLEEVA